MDMFRWLFFILSFLILPLSVSAMTSSAGERDAISTRQELSRIYDDDMEIKRVSLFYRLSGSRVYASKVLDISEDGQVSIDFPVEVMSPPGIEYYLRIEMVDGSVLTDPEIYPEYNPYRFEIKKQTAVDIRLLGQGGSNVIAPADRLVLNFQGNGHGQIASVFLDGVDISQAVVIHEQGLIYKPPAQLEPGRHHITLLWDDQGETELGFQVSDKNLQRKSGVLTVDGSLSFNYGANVSSGSSASSSNSLSANMHVGMSAEKGDFSMKFSGINMQYIHNAEDKFNLSSGYLLSADYGQQRFEMGDLSINETPLTVAGFSRRGLQAKMQYGDIQFHAFNVNAETVQGFNSGLSFSSSDNQIYGFSLISPELFDDKMKLHLTAVSGTRMASSGSNSSSILPPASGHTLGGKVSVELLGARWQGEYAVSRYDNDINDNLPAKSDSAYEFNISRNMAIGNLSLGFLRYGSDYATIANPNFTGDRQSYNASLSNAFGYVSTSLSARYAEDNIANDPTKPIIASNSGNASVSVVLPDWPSIQLAYSLSSQNNKQTVPGTQPLDNQNKNYSLNIAYNRQNWNLSLAANLGQLDDRLINSNDSKTRNYNLSGGVKLGEMSISPTLSLNKTIKPSLDNTSKLATLSLSGPLWRDDVHLSSQASYQLSSASDNSVDTSRSNISLRLSWNLKKVLKRVGAEWGNVQLGLSANYTDFTDKINAANDTDDYSILMTFNMGAPYNFEVQRPW